MSCSPEITDVLIGPEHAGERKAIRVVHELAFGGTREADIVEALCEPCVRRLSLVARLGDTIVGHVLFTQARIEGLRPVLIGMALAPLAVLPELQGRGIGSRLIAAGLTELRAAGTGYVVVIGHPEFYARHGFVPATRYGLRCEYPGVPEAAFRVSVLDSTLAGQMMGGVLRFRPEFAPAAEA